MKQYICLNHGECNWADETPPREFSLPDREEHFCPNCESGNIKEKPKSSGLPWTKIAVAVGLIFILAGLVWLFWPKTIIPLALQVSLLNCETGTLSLTTTGGDDNPVIFKADGLESKNGKNEFSLPAFKRSGKKIRLYAMQNGVTVDTTYSINCPDIVPFPPPPPPRVDPKVSSSFRKVKGSEFCGDNCTLYYSEIDNLGHTREKKIENYTECCSASK